MKVINLITNIVFDLPKEDVEQLVKVSPDTFAKLSKNKKVIKNKKDLSGGNTLLDKILDE